MRKILLASTALVALTSVSAMAEVDGITGTYEFGYSDISGDGVATDGTSYYSEADVDIKFSNTADNGMTATFGFGMDEGGTTDSTASLSGDFGMLSFVTNGLDDEAVNGLDIDVDGATPEENSPTSTDGAAYYTGANAFPGGNVISYTAPSMVDGLTIALSHNNAAEDSEGMAYGLKYTTDANGAAISVAATSTSIEAGTVENDYTHYGLSVSASGFTIMLESNSRDNGTATGSGSDMSSTGVGATYAVGSLTLGAYQRNAESGNAADDYSETAFGATYTIAPGISAGITQTSTDLDATAGRHAFYRPGAAMRNRTA
jgi:hypothetical protein